MTEYEDDLRELQARFAQLPGEAANLAAGREATTLGAENTQALALSELRLTAADQPVLKMLMQYLDEVKALKDTIADKEHELSELTRQRGSWQVPCSLSPLAALVGRCPISDRPSRRLLRICICLRLRRKNTLC